MKIIVVGKGGREHALATALAVSPGQHTLYSFPGSDAIAALAERVPGSGMDSLLAWIETERPDLVVAGEEAWLVQGEGLANVCERLGIPCWGPHKASAQLEASKEFAKEFMVRHDIPTGGYASTASYEEAFAAIANRYPTVLKFDGLAAGKGVAVCPDEASAKEFLDVVFTRRQFGAGRLLVEEFLTGPEISIFASVCDGKYHILCPARDYKRLGNGDAGPNTGGMGAVAGRGLASIETIKRIEDEMVRPTVEGLVADGLPYRGFLYFGIMLTPDGPKLLEYNCRFGDPECQAVMPLVSGDFAAYCLAGAKGALDPALIDFSEGWSVGVVLASAGYPATSRSGDPIAGLEAVSPDCRVYHAGTRLGENGYETNGGRVLAVVAGGSTRGEAVARAHAEAAKVDFRGSQRRSDIGIAGF
ncbi:MAG: phosphoribosylamine--glycine ligase [Verrucomicrobiales bacterium]